MMTWRAGLIAALLAATLIVPLDLTRAQDCGLTPAQQAALRAEHLFGGPPSPGEVLVRRGYVTQYDTTHRVPRWTAWHAAPDYLGTPNREGPWAAFRTDPSVPNPVSTSDYVGVGVIGMARGHIIPYFMAGGDRDGDGLRAADSEGELLDEYDACTVFEVNYMTNIAPQWDSDDEEWNFNGPGGLWYQLETRIREDIVGAGVPIHVIAGTVFGAADIERVGAGDIPVPHMFFQILITPYGVVPFLFTHSAQVAPQGCALTAALRDCIVAIADIEPITGLDFFAALDSAFEALLQTPDGQSVWQVLVDE